MAKGKKTGGRQKGTPNSTSIEVKALAREYGPSAIEKLAELAGLVEGKKCADTDQAKITAANSLLDRGYGKPVQDMMLTDPAGNNPFAPLMELVAANGRPRPGR